jgi:benzoate membrane transport protein
MSLNMRETHWPQLISSATAATVVGFASTILVVIEGARAAGASAGQQASAAAAVCFAMVLTSTILSVRYRQPLMTAWSTPGSALLATSAAGVVWPEAIGAFVFAGALMLLTSVLTPLSRAIAKMPAAIASAMLAGVLLRYVLGVPVAAVEAPQYALPLVLVFFALRFVVPMFAVPIMVAFGLVLAVLSGGISGEMPIEATALEFVWPQWNPQVLLGLGIPLYLVTMASQNLPGFAVLRANGYDPPVGACLAVTGVGSMLAAPLGSHAVNMAAITASIVAEPTCHPDPARRWKMIFAYAPLYLVIGLAAGTFVALLGGLPKPLVTTIAGLALFAPLLGSLSAMASNSKHLEPALVTFLVTASGIALFGVGSAFWGLVAGLLLWGAQRLR